MKYKKIENHYIVRIDKGEEVIASPYSAIARKLRDEDRVKKVDKSQLFEN